MQQQRGITDDRRTTRERRGARLVNAVLEQEPALDHVHEYHGHYLEDLAVGQRASYARTVTEADIVLFAGISGDVNPIHLNHEFAADTRFGNTIAHGMLSAGFISTVLGTRLPGPGCIYLGQTLRFLAPVRAGDTVVAWVTIADIDEKRRAVVCETRCLVKDTLVIEGEATMMVSRRKT